MTKQVLPQSERDFLAVLIGNELKARVKALSEGGWSLGAIAEAFVPPKQRSSVRVWATGKTQPRPDHPPIPIPPSPSPSSTSKKNKTTLPAAEKIRRARREHNPSTPSKALTPAVKETIQRLAPLARQYRARANPNGTYAQANAELTELCKDLYFKQGLSVRELSNAAGVTYRAMARRIGVGK
jgi:hypothetical protein